MMDETPRRDDKDARLAPTSTAPSLPVTLFNLLLAAICLIYLVNPTSGMLELIPDIIPVVGNLDEATATLLLVRALYGTGKLNGVLDPLLQAGLLKTPRRED